MDEFSIGYKEYNRSNISRARKMRKNPTLAEEKMWESILKNRPGWYKFTRQKPIGSFIVDFYCSKLLLGIEVDGSSHNNKQEYDKQRDERLRHNGIKIIRFTNQEIYNNLEWVRQEIMKIIENL